MAQAFCVWDGGRLETVAEFEAAGASADYGVGANGTQPPPWGAPIPHGIGDGTDFNSRYPTASDATLGLDPSLSVEWANWDYSYEWPHLVNTDYIVFINPPGRLKARSPNGHADLVGNMMEVSGDVNADSSDPAATLVHWTANGSWEGHPWGFYGWNFSLLTKYGKQGLRCVYPD
jgi:hypothetical protein